MEFLWWLTPVTVLLSFFSVALAPGIAESQKRKKEQQNLDEQLFD